MQASLYSDGNPSLRLLDVASTHFFEEQSVMQTADHANCNDMNEQNPSKNCPYGTIGGSMVCTR